MALGLSQNLSINGLQLLSAIIPEQNKPFDLWLPLNSQTMLPATATAAWVAVEDSFGDHPYWVRSGIHLALKRDDDRALLIDYIQKKLGSDKSTLESTDPKIGYIF